MSGECAGTCGLARAGRGLYCDGCGECWPDDGSVVLAPEQVAQVREALMDAWACKHGKGICRQCASAIPEALALLEPKP